MLIIFVVSNFKFIDVFELFVVLSAFSNIQSAILLIAVTCIAFFVTTLPGRSH
ncbi:hypothetical protein FDUTEX481_00004 [Tolypothrix sp. PCC 7601]|nr:hypothetical protein FDUTEX481_00004 [Tolypothrix sp. PCC 7601]